MTESMIGDPKPADDCYHKAKAKNEPVFTLRAQDQSAVTMIGLWITANIETASPEKLHDALNVAMKMRQWGVIHKTKSAD